MSWTADPRVSRALWTAGLVLLVAFPFYADTYSVTTLIRVFYFGLLAVSTGFLIGQGGMVSLGQVAFSGVAGYTIGLFAYEREMPFVLAILLAFAAVVVVSFAFGLVAMRTHGLVFLMITLAFGQICWAFAQQNTSLLHGWAGIRGIRPPTVLGIDFKSTPNFYWAALVLFALALLLLHRITRSRFGLALNGVRESPRRMAALGYPVYWIRVISFVLAALYAGAGGILATYSTGIITPTSLQLSRTIWVLLMVILGGATYFWGPVLGTVVTVGLDVLISQYSERYNLVIGVIFLLVILFAPNGILGGLERFRPKRPRTLVLATDAVVPATDAEEPATDAVAPATEGSGVGAAG